jgi:hypothetical protein
MERLPQEVVARIAEYLPKRHEGKQIRAALATLSSQWQYAIERFTFKSLHITSDDLEDFYAAFASHSTRRSFLRDLHLDIILPQHSDDDSADYETAAVRAANNDVFSRHVSALLQDLSQWPAGGGKLNLVIGTDPTRKVESYSCIRLSGTLPAAVPRVTSFYAHTGPRYLDPASQIALTAAFPNLERISWPFEDPAYFLALRRQQMQEAAAALASFQPPSMCNALNINISSPWYPHKERLPNLNSGDSSFCGSLCAMLGRSNIQYLDYSGPIDPTLFWPQEAPETDEAPSSWTCMQDVEVRFGLGSLAGQWFFKGPPGDPFYDESSDVPLPQDAEGFLPPGYYDNDEENEEAMAHAESMEMPDDDEGFTMEGCEFRWAQRDEAILPLLTAAARRVAHTPSLLNFYLESTLPLDRGVWFFSYQAPGEMSQWEEYVDCTGSGCDDPLSRARVFLHAGEWSPDEEVVALLHGIGKACHGEDALVTILPFLY